MDEEDSMYPTDGVDETTASKDTAPPADDSEAMESEESLLPKSFFQGKELTVGSECKVKITHIYDDEVSVSYVPHSDGEKTPDDETMESAQNQLGAMATEA